MSTCNRAYVNVCFLAYMCLVFSDYMCMNMSKISLFFFIIYMQAIPICWTCVSAPNFRLCLTDIQYMILININWKLKQWLCAVMPFVLNMVYCSIHSYDGNSVVCLFVCLGLMAPSTLYIYRSFQRHPIDHLVLGKWTGTETVIEFEHW